MFQLPLAFGINRRRSRAGGFRLPVTLFHWSLFPVPCSLFQCRYIGEYSGNIRGVFWNGWKLRLAWLLYLLVFQPVRNFNVGVSILRDVSFYHAFLLEFRNPPRKVFVGVGVVRKQRAGNSGEGSPTPPRIVGETPQADEQEPGVPRKPPYRFGNPELWLDGSYSHQSTSPPAKNSVMASSSPEPSIFPPLATIDFTPLMIVMA